jgi:hypothetical protein
MCDYSITVEKSRPAVVGDKLTVTQFGSSRGFAPQGAGEPEAVCLLPGTELAFARPVSFCYYGIPPQGTTRIGDTVSVVTAYATAIFRQADKDNLYKHHDVLEFPDGMTALVTMLDPGQTATVLQLPATPHTEAEHQEQRRVEYVG